MRKGGKLDDHFRHGLPRSEGSGQGPKGTSSEGSGRPWPGPSVLEGAPYSGLAGSRVRRASGMGPGDSQSSGISFGLAAGEEELGQDSQELNWLSGRPPGRRWKVSGPCYPSEKDS